MQPHVFVVMPFGAKEARAATPAAGDTPAGAAITIDFDLVYQRLIAPALTKAGCVPFRADQEPGAGDIRTDMFFELVTADVVVADISVLNANVFYELGVRHGVAPRGVFMIHGGWAKPPFDVAPDRTFDYDGKLFLPEAMEPEDDWPDRLDAEAERLGQIVEARLRRRSANHRQPRLQRDGRPEAGGLERHPNRAGQVLRRGVRRLEGARRGGQAEWLAGRHPDARR